MKNKKKYKQRLVDEAFVLYKQHDRNASKVSRILRDKYESAPSKVTVLQWAEKYDWDGTIDKMKEVVKETLLTAKDPLIKRLIRDDVFQVEVLALLQGLAGDAIQRRRSKVTPRSTSDLVMLLKFIADQLEKRVPLGKPQPVSATGDHSASKTLNMVLSAILGEDFKQKPVLTESVIGDLRKKLRLIVDNDAERKAAS